MESGSVLSGRATQILQGQFPPSTQTFHFGSEPWHDKHSRTEEHCTIEDDYRQRVSFAEPIQDSWPDKNCDGVSLPKVRPIAKCLICWL